MPAPIYAIFVEDIGGDLLDASITAGIFAVATELTTLASGKFSDKIKNSELVVVFGYLLLGGGFIAMTQVNSIAALFVVQAIIGIAEAIYAPAFDSLYSRHLDKHHEGSEWGSWEAMNYFTYAGGAIVGELIVKMAGFDGIFIAMAILCISSAIYIYFLPRRTL